ncbi:MAG TPA: outer membrane beta-barrel protein, partial [Saprospiraceae bacterium]|nr:outer membrane beta-barrel protein [Saprospiraceae bacterium]
MRLPTLLTQPPSWLGLTSLLVLCFGFAFSAHAQPRFKAAAIVGLTASQINGDRSAGYHKLGLQAGLRGIARLREREELSIEFLYAQRGSQSTLIKDQFDPYRFSHTLNYLEVPVQWHYKDWLVEFEDEKDNFYRASFNIGLSYARLINYSNGGEGAGISAALPYLKKGDISFLLGANFMASRHLGFAFRYVRSLGRMYDPRDYD